MTDKQQEQWTAGKTKCNDCGKVIDAAGQCDCDYNPLWWDTPNRRRLLTNTKARRRNLIRMDIAERWLLGEYTEQEARIKLLECGECEHNLVQYANELLATME